MTKRYENSLTDEELIALINAEDAARTKITVVGRRRNFRRDVHDGLKMPEGLNKHEYLEGLYVGKKIELKSNRRLPATLSRFLHKLSVCCGDGWVTNTSQKKLAEISRLHINTIANCVKECNQLGLIRTYHNYDFVDGVWQRVSSTTVMVCVMNHIKWLAKQALKASRLKRIVKPTPKSIPTASTLVNTSDVALFLYKNNPPHIFDTNTGEILSSAENNHFKAAIPDRSPVLAA